MKRTLQSIFLSLLLTLSSQSCYTIMNNSLYRAARTDAPKNTDGSPVGTLLTCDQEKVLIPLNKLKKDITNCCNILQKDFNGTFTTLIDITEIFTTCCSTIQNDIQGTFTALSDIKTTLTVCCTQIANDFDQTFTILAEGFLSTFTAIFDINTTLTTCCTQIEIDFENVFTALSNLNLNCGNSTCNEIPITSPMTITIPGAYCLANDIVGTIIINANNVTLDLNQHTISGIGMGGGNGIIITSGSNRVVKNGRIVNVDTGIICTNNTDTILQNIVIDTAFVEGITITNGTSIQLDSLLTINILGIGVHFTGNNNYTLINESTVTLSQEGFVFDTLTNSIIKNCNVLDCSTTQIIPTGNTVGGFTVINGSFIQFHQCTVKNYIAFDLAAAFSLNNVTNVLFKACSVQNIVATIPSSFGSIAVGFNCGGNSSTIQFIDCSVLDAAADLFAGGFLLSGDNITLNSCIARRFTTVTIPPSFGDSIGFQMTNNNVTLTNCEAYECGQTGFLIIPLGGAITSALYNCVSAFNTEGFNTGSANTFFENCLAFKNSTGFFSSVAGISITECLSTQNTINYGGASGVNTQNANTQVNNTAVGLTGPFAGGNLFV